MDDRLNAIAKEIQDLDLKIETLEYQCHGTGAPEEDAMDDSSMSGYQGVNYSWGNLFLIV